MRRPAYHLTQPGWVILAAVVALMALGVACIYVTNTHYTRTNDGPVNAATDASSVANLAGCGWLTFAAH